jgi:hypothetical protein
VEDWLGDADSSTLERLKDSQVKLCAARNEHYAGSPRHMVNHTKTGTVNHLTFLMHTRKDWSPVCKEDNLSTNHIHYPAFEVLLLMSRVSHR